MPSLKARTVGKNQQKNKLKTNGFVYAFSRFNVATQKKI